MEPMDEEELPAVAVYDDVDEEMTYEELPTPPLILSWGRSDTHTLLRTPAEEASSAITALSFASSRTILQISSNLYHTAAVTSTGEVYVCGANDEGQTQPNGMKTDEYDTKPKLVEELGNHRICAVSCGLYHTVCLTSTGLVVSYGGNEAGQCGHSPSKHSNVTPKVVDFHSPSKDRIGTVLVKQVACGDMFTLFLSTSGQVYACGIGAYTGLNGTGQRKNENAAVAERIDALAAANVSVIAAGAMHALAITSTGTS